MKVYAPTAEAIERAAAALREGELVAMPTETVYGLAADATNEAAVRRTFEVKGRPAENPLIVHGAALADFDEVVAEFSPEALRLAEAFWPGPLTLVLPRHPLLSPLVSGGLASVAVRCPAHPVAQALIRATGRPLTAPSANLFQGLSPTRVEHLSPEILAAVACALDGGPCAVGIESTVLDLTRLPARILRPGVLGSEALGSWVELSAETQSDAPRHASPGQYARHYAPRTPVRLVKRLRRDQPGLTFEPPQGPHQIQAPPDPEGYARALYETLFRLDAAGAESLYLQMPPERPEWEAVWDRLRRAAGEGA